MPLIIPYDGIKPVIDDSAWIADNATITGNVHIGAESSIWFQTVIRGDVNKIQIGNRVNIQDGSMVHGTFGRNDTIIEDGVSVGHRAIIHGCHIKENVLVGMGAIVLDDAVLEPGCIVAAGAVVTAGMHLESGYIYAGIPAKKIKEISPEQAAIYLKGTSDAYVKYSREYMGKSEKGIR